MGNICLGLYVRSYWSITVEMMNTLEILTLKLAIWFLRRGWGNGCATSDLDEFYDASDRVPLSRKIRQTGRCGSCRARETIDFLTETIDLLET